LNGRFAVSSVDRQQVGERRGIVKQAINTVVAVVLFLVSKWVVMSAEIAGVWLTEELRVFGLVMLPTAIIAGLLVVYFDWRAKLLNQIRDERNQYQKAA
jgi:hypothetical protein